MNNKVERIGKTLVGEKEYSDTITILKCSAGDPHGMHAMVDPYWNIPGGWAENARGDGMSYAGILETLYRQPGESDEEFVARANARADELEETL
jgi:hypothetical protein